MDDGNDAAIAKFGVVLMVLLLLACFKSYQELRYACSGKETTATITNIAENRGRRGGLTGYRVWYRFFREDTKRNFNGFTNIGVDEVHKYAPGQKIAIQYYGGKLCSSRIEGTGSLFWIGLLGVSVVGFIGAVVWMSVRAKN